MEKIIFKFWFRNGAYIEREVIIDDSFSTEDKIELAKNCSKIQDIVKESFREKTLNFGAQITVGGMTVRVDELIAFDMIPVEDVKGSVSD